MRVWTKCVWDSSGNIIEDESCWEEYEGPLAEATGGGGQSTTTVDPPTAEETALTVKQTELAQFQLDELRRQTDLQAAEQERLAPLIAQLEELQPLQLDLAKQDLSRALELGPIQDELLQLELENIKRGGAATPTQIELIGEATERGIELGESDIAKFQQDATERIAQELAPALGLRPTDTPVIDRASRIAEEAVRQQGQLVSGLRQAEATAKLNFPLAAQQLQSAQTQFQQNLAQSTQEFQGQLRNAAFLNRLRLSESPQRFGLGLATGVSVPSLGRAPTGSTTRTSGGGLGLSGIGSILSGVGAIGGLFSSSSRELKRDPEGIGLATEDQSVDLAEDEEGVYRPARQLDHEKTLAKVEKLPVERWRYKEGLGLGDRDHIGPYAENFTEEFGLGDGKTISVIDAIGIGLSATKGLAERVHKIEHGIGLAGA